MNNRIGIIDIGTNTFNLLIVDKGEVDYKKAYSTKVGVGLGLGGINEGVITTDAILRGVDTLKDYVAKCNEMGARRVKAFATSAVRDAKNKDEFLNAVQQEMDLEIEVISGEREAELIYEGVKLGYAFKNPALIMDIGGGSTEFIYANKDEVIKSHSFNIGTARIYQLFDFEDPYTRDNINSVTDYLDTNTEGFFEGIQTDVLVGASGSFETFYAILNKREYPENEFEDMEVEDIMPILDEMITSSLDERMKNEFIIPIRKKMAPIAAIKIKWILKKLDIKTLTISPFAMKEAVINIV